MNERRHRHRFRLPCSVHFSLARGFGDTYTAAMFFQNTAGLDIRPFTDGEGIGRCHLVMEQVVIPVEPRPCRPFQGWRYLAATDAPRDLGQRGEGAAAMPEELRRELAGLGLL